MKTSSLHSPVSVVMTTFMPPLQEKERLARAVEVVRSWGHHLEYDGLLQLIIQDDFSAFDIEPLVVEAKLTHLFDNIVYARGTGGVGASLNRGQRTAWETGPVTLYAVDDWELLQDFDITPWVELLEIRYDVGCVRLGPPHPGLLGLIEAMTPHWQGWAMRLARGTGIAAAHRPALWHKRFFEAYGWWDEDVSAISCESEMNARYQVQIRDANGRQTPDIVYALPHPWYHLQPHEGDISMSEWNAR